MVLFYISRTLCVFYFNFVMPLKVSRGQEQVGVRRIKQISLTAGLSLNKMTKLFRLLMLSTANSSLLTH